MAETMRFESVGMVVGKNFDKAYKGFERDGKIQGAHDDRYLVYVIVGSLRKKGVLFDGEPKIAKGSVSPHTFVKIKDFDKIKCEVEQKIMRENIRYKLLSVPGWDIVSMNDDDDDEETDIDEDELILARIESGEIKSPDKKPAKESKK